MSEIKNGRLDQHGTERFGILISHFATIRQNVGIKGLIRHLQTAKVWSILCSDLLTPFNWNKNSKLQCDIITEQNVYWYVSKLFNLIQYSAISARVNVINRRAVLTPALQTERQIKLDTGIRFDSLCRIDSNRLLLPALLSRLLYYRRPDY